MRNVKIISALLMCVFASACSSGGTGVSSANSGYDIPTYSSSYSSDYYSYTDYENSRNKDYERYYEDYYLFR